LSQQVSCVFSSLKSPAAELLVLLLLPPPPPQHRPRSAATVNASREIFLIDMASGGTELKTQDLAGMIRSWIHFDNLAATFNRQSQQARSARARWEEQVLGYLRTNSLTNAIIQIAGGRLTVVEEKHAQPLTLQRMEALLHEYFSKRPAGSTDETADIMAFIKANRGSTLETRLKKS